MAHEVLARKWRPQTFGEVVGQTHVTETLVNAIASGRLAHAYLFGGPRGVGKTSVARILAKALNCAQRQGAEPCNKCSSCIEITEGYSVDVQEIDGASNRGIDEIRELRENIKYMPQSGIYRIYIIDEVHMLTLQAFNALLKTLEEPPEHVKFIFATTEPRKVPVTILSRCQRFDFRRIPLQEIVSHLDRITKSEGIEIGKPELTLIAREADGSMRDAQSLLDQVVSSLGSKVSGRDILDILGVVDTGVMIETCEAIVRADQRKCLEIVEKIYNSGYDIKSFYSSLMERFRDLLISLIGPKGSPVDMEDHELEASMNLAKEAGLERLQAILDLLIKREEDLRYSSHPRLVLETVLIRLCGLDQYLSFEQVLQKIENLEKAMVARIGHYGSQVADSTEPAWSSPSRKPRTWDEFLQFVKGKNRPMANVLAQWQYLGMQDQTLRIGRGGETFSSTYFDDPVKKEALEGLCRAFWGDHIVVDLAEAQGGQTKAVQSEDVPDTPRSSVTESQQLPEPVRKVLDTFEGKIISNDSGKGG